MKPSYQRLVSTLYRPLAATLLVATAGCKPAATPSKEAASPPEERSGQKTANNPRRPTQEDLTTFFQSTSSSYVRLTEAKMDPPTLMPDTSPADNVWLCKVKLTFVPTEDLLGLPSTEDVRAIEALNNELNSLIQWRNRYVDSPYARACGNLEVVAPVATVPQLILIPHPKDQSLPPVYGKMAAEWQVDHWRFSTVELDLSVDGKPRREYAGNTMVKGSAEAEAFFKSERDAIARARRDIEAIKSRYADEITKAIKPGTVYQGQIIFHQTTLPCELRFVDGPPGGDARAASFTITLRDAPTYQFTYNARVTRELPVTLPPPAPTPTSEYEVPIIEDPKPAPKVNLLFSLARSAGEESNKAAPGQMLAGARHNMGPDHGLLVLAGRIEGMISYYQAPFNIAVQQAK